MSDISSKLEKLFNSYNQNNQQLLETNLPQLNSHLMMPEPDLSGWNLFGQISRQMSTTTVRNNEANNGGGSQINYQLNRVDQLFSLCEQNVPAEPPQPQQQQFIESNDNQNQISEELLDDLSSRFVLNMPSEEQEDPIRICFQIEIAHWFYNDFYCVTFPVLPKLKLKAFARIMFRHIPRLRKLIPDFDQVISNWVEYKFSIPCSGAIMLDSSLDHVLLVQGYGGKTWGFPKGKVNHDETLLNCAIREVLEETGYDCSSKICSEAFLEKKVFDSNLRLFFVTDVEMDYDFAPHVRNEIRSIKWFALKDLPDRKKCANANDFSKMFTVCPFVMSIRKWVDGERRRRLKNDKRRQRKEKQRSRVSSNETDDSQPVGNGDDNNDGGNSCALFDCNGQFNSTSSSPFEAKESTSFVDVKLDDILDLSYPRFDSPQPNQTSAYQDNGHNGPNQSSVKSNSDWPSTWKSLVSEYNRLNISQTGGGQPSPTFPTVASPPDNVFKTLSSIETTTAQPMGRTTNSPMSIPFSKFSAKSSCDEKLSLLFGMAQNNVQFAESNSYKENFNSLNQLYATGCQTTATNSTNVNEIFNSNLFKVKNSVGEQSTSGMQSPFGTIGSGHTASTPSHRMLELKSPDQSHLYLNSSNGNGLPANTSCISNGNSTTTDRYSGLDEKILPHVENKIQQLLQRLKFLNSN